MNSLGAPCIWNHNVVLLIPLHPKMIDGMHVFKIVVIFYIFSGSFTLGLSFPVNVCLEAQCFTLSNGVIKRHQNIYESEGN